MIVIPGDIVKNKDENTYENNGKYYSKYLGLLEEKGEKIKITRLFGYYIPKLNDIVIGKVIDVTPIGWLIDINSQYLGYLLLKDMNIENIDPNDLYTYEDYVLCQIIKITKNKIINLIAKKKEKLNDGLIIDVDPMKIPRIIGKNSSMINMLKELLKVEIIVGQNGRIYINGEETNVLRTVNAIKFIEENSYKKGLTEKVKEMIEKNKI
ncbi:MAG: KH domain-containing protein [Nanopusillaceae archaeon]|jgi:exosome complex component RRP4